MGVFELRQNSFPAEDNAFRQAIKRPDGNFLPYVKFVVYRQ
ncbi:hypothetical protein BN135_2627 [Cronobacter muytjensii 530]